MLFAPPKIVEKPIEVVIKEPSNEWRKQDAYLDSLQTADSLRIDYLNKRITKRENTINRLKTIIFNDTTKTTNEADSIIRSQDSTINDLGNEAEIYSSKLHTANEKIVIRDSVITVRDSTIMLCNEIMKKQSTTIAEMRNKAKIKEFWQKVKDKALIIESTAMAIFILVK
jgi:archaellum component FlaC